MYKKSKLRVKILSGSAKNIDFSDLCTFLSQNGFSVRQSGSHRNFFKDEVVEILTLEPLPDGTAKAYQVRQARDIFQKYKL